MYLGWSNFWDAFAVWEYGLDLLEGYRGDVQNRIAVIRSTADVGNWKSSLYHCAAAIDKLSTMIWTCTLGGTSNPKICGLYDSVYWSFFGGDGGVELEMEMIINAMLAATPYEVNYFVGLVDAYRQSLWNKSFNSEFFAALARGFEQWE